MTFQLYLAQPAGVGQGLTPSDTCGTYFLIAAHLEVHLVNRPSLRPSVRELLLKDYSYTNIHHCLWQVTHLHSRMNWSERTSSTFKIPTEDSNLDYFDQNPGLI